MNATAIASSTPAPSEPRLLCGAAKPATTTPVITLIAGSATSRRVRSGTVMSLSSVSSGSSQEVSSSSGDITSSSAKKRSRIPYRRTIDAVTQTIRKAGKNALSSSSVTKIEIGTTFPTTTSARRWRRKSIGRPANARQAASAVSGVRAPRSQGSAGRSSLLTTFSETRFSIRTKNQPTSRICQNDELSRLTYSVSSPTPPRTTT